MFSVQSIVFSVQCTLFNVKCSVYSVQCTLFDIKCSMYSGQSSVNSMECLMYSVKKKANIFLLQCNFYIKSIYSFCSSEVSIDDHNLHSS